MTLLHTSCLRFFYIVYPPFVCDDRLHLGMRLIAKRIYGLSCVVLTV